jgi:6-phosphogluconolactonase
MHARSQWLYVGTQRSGDGTGFSRLGFDSTTGTLSSPALVAVVPDPSLFVVTADGAHLYTCNSGTPGGISAFRVDRAAGTLTGLNHHISIGRGPSQLSLDRSERFVLAANYGGGYLEVVAINDDGSLGGQTAMVQHDGSSVHPDRQTHAYVHCAMADPTNRFVLVADLGTDEVVVYRFDSSAGRVTPHAPPITKVKAGSGPRHLAWHPNGSWLYVIEELSNEVTVFDWNSDSGVLTERQTVRTLPEDFVGENTAAEILVRADGRYLYASNRGHDSVVVYAIANDGTLSVVERVASEGRTPRYLAFDTTGRWLIAANCDSDSVVVFGIDADSGRLSMTGAPVHVARPYGLVLVERATLKGDDAA